jgi:pimeloyl-ACP methyl ester carboxylesterase
VDERTREDPEEREQLVDVGGHRLVLRWAGTGWPAVVLDAGLGETSTVLEWASVLRGVAAFTQCCAYARAGLGGSELGRGPRTSLQAAEELQVLLHRAELAGPYVLVGHSLGGLHVQLFAARHPAEVAGLVLVDATYEDHFGWLAQLQLPPEVMEQERRSAAGDNLEEIAFDSALAALQHARWRLDVPLVVLIRDHVPPGEQPPDWSPERETLLLATWSAVQAELASHSPRGRLVVAEGSGHNIQRYRPDLILAAIREVVFGVRGQ